MQHIKATVVMDIPPEKIIIDRAEYEELQRKIDSGNWWTTKDIEERYHHKMEWLKENIFYQPQYKKILSTEFGGPVHYSDVDNGRYWSFEPTRFKEFMQQHFSEINK